MVARAYTVAFEGIEARLVEVQCAISPGIPAFSMVCYIEKPLLISSWFKITKADIGESRSEGLERAHFDRCCNVHQSLKTGVKQSFDEGFCVYTVMDWMGLYFE